jgi:hypothetical protein
MAGDVVEAKWNAMAREKMPDRDAEGGPRKLDEGEHGVYMTEARRNFEIEEVATMNQQCESVISWGVCLCLKGKVNNSGCREYPG